MKKINTVLGEISSDELGIVLMHEHLYANNSGWWHCPACSNRFFLAEEKENIGIFKPVFISLMWTICAIWIPCIMHDNNYSIMLIV